MKGINTPGQALDPGGVAFFSDHSSSTIHYFHHNSESIDLLMIPTDVEFLDSVTN